MSAAYPKGMTHRNDALLVAGLLALVTACSSTPRVQPAAEASRPASHAHKIRPLHDHMQEHFVRMDVMQQALVAGDFERVKREANWILERPEPDGMPAAWTPFILELMRSARAVRATNAPAAMARQVARMGAACGRCHQSLGLQLKLTWVAPPASTREPKVHMRRHLWAVERFWDGLVSSDSRGWRAGAKVFHDDALLSEDMTDDERIDPHVEQLATDLHDFGQTAGETVDVEDKIDLYGRLLTTCATCHHDVGKGPSSPPDVGRPTVPR